MNVVVGGGGGRVAGGRAILIIRSHGKRRRGATTHRNAGNQKGRLLDYGMKTEQNYGPSYNNIGRNGVRV